MRRILDAFEDLALECRRFAGKCRSRKCDAGKKASPPTSTGRAVVGGDIRRMEASLVSRPHPRADACSVSCPSGHPNQRPNRRRQSLPHAINAILRSRVPRRPLSSRPPRPFIQQTKKNPNSGGDCGFIESSVNPQDSTPHFRRVSAVYFLCRIADRYDFSRLTYRVAVRGRHHFDRAFGRIQVMKRVSAIRHATVN